MFSPLLEDIIKREKITVVNEDNLDEFLAENGDVILFIGGDHKRLVEVNDVAVILPELVKASNNTLTPAVAERDSERKMQLRYRFNAFPSLVFLRNGQYLGVISRVLDWTDYIREINEILAKEPVQPPAFKLPDGCATPAKDADSPPGAAFPRGAVPPKDPAPSIVDQLIEKGADNV